MRCKKWYCFCRNICKSTILNIYTRFYTSSFPLTMLFRIPLLFHGKLIIWSTQSQKKYKIGQKGRFMQYIFHTYSKIIKMKIHSIQIHKSVSIWKVLKLFEKSLFRWSSPILFVVVVLESIVKTNSLKTCDTTSCFHCMCENFRHEMFLTFRFFLFHSIKRKNNYLPLKSSDNLTDIH